MKRCPFCAEAIQDDTQVCPHCQTKITGNVYAPPAAQPPATAPGPGSYSQSPAPVAPIGGDVYATPPPPPPTETSGKAIGSLVSALVFPFFGGIVAIILGHISLSEIKKSAGRLKGDGLAMAGLILGYLQVAGLPFLLIIAAIAIPNLLRSRMAANEASAVGSLRTLVTAETSYATVCPRIGFAYSLTELGPRGSVCPPGRNLIDFTLASGLKSGYRFTPHTSSFSGQSPEAGFGWNADPLTPSTTGTRHFFVDQTGVIRVSTAGPADEASEPLQ